MKKRRAPITDTRLLNASHYTYGQVQRLIGIGNQSIRDRVASGKATRVVIAGVNMLARADVVEWIVEREERRSG